MRLKSIFLTIFVSVLASCGGQNGGNGHSEGKAGQNDVLLFPDVRVPSVISTEEEAARFLSEHYWDNFTDPSRGYPSDSARVSGVSKAEVEQKFANYAAIIGMVPHEHALKSVKELYVRTEKCEFADSTSNVYETMAELVEKYFYDANSPYRDEDLYAVFAESLSKSDFVEPVMRDKYQFDARMCSLNRVGTKAADFVFCDIRGKRRNLYGIESEMTLVFFSNPGCEACREIMEMIKSSGHVSALISDGKLTVVNMYIDENLDEWKAYMEVYPDEWCNVYDPDYRIRTDLTYNVRAIPSLYLLDRDKTVLMKDAVPQKVFLYLENDGL